ncbi:MAG: hypothetical protein RR288_03575, partial [Oscillibacter sp.]
SKDMKTCFKSAGILLTVCLLVGCATNAPSSQGEAKQPATPPPSFENFVREYPINARYALVESQKEGNAPRFDLWDKESNAVQNLPTMPAYTKLQEIVNENEFIFLATGENSETAIRSFPCLIRCFRVGGDGLEPFVRVEEEKCFALSERVQAGSARKCNLAAIHVSFEGISVLFAPNPGHEADFYGAASDIPLTDISCENGVMTLHFASCTSALAEDAQLAHNPYLTDCTVTQTGEDVQVSLSLGAAVTGYYANKNVAHDPFLTIRFVE